MMLAMSRSCAEGPLQSREESAHARAEEARALVTSRMAKRKAGWKPRSPRLGVLLILAGANAIGCATREDNAVRAARAAALLAERACRDAGSTEGCREPICRDQCDRFADSARLVETCIDKCLGRGTCDSDSDCRDGLLCIVIAPRVRRCAPRSEGEPGAPP